jgi:hypothetical protein
MDPIGVRIQSLPKADQVLSLARIAEGRSQSGRFAPADVDRLFDETTLPRPSRVSNFMLALEKKGLLGRSTEAGPSWYLTPIGRARATEVASDMDLAALILEGPRRSVTVLADTPHPLIPPSLAPPELIGPLREFFMEYPFAQNVFGMTRFPGTPGHGKLDPIAPALEVARDVCRLHGLVFHLASDRQIVDDLWANVAAHIWGSQHTIAFYEDRTGKGLNYNLNIEVGSTLVLGRRLAILKDKPVQRLPTDLVGRIYKEVDLTKPTTVAGELHGWCRDDLKLGPCSRATCQRRP